MKFIRTRRGWWELLFTRRSRRRRSLYPVHALQGGHAGAGATHEQRRQRAAQGILLSDESGNPIDERDIAWSCAHVAGAGATEKNLWYTLSGPGSRTGAQCIGWYGVAKPRTRFRPTHCSNYRYEMLMGAVAAGEILRAWRSPRPPRRPQPPDGRNDPMPAAEATDASGRKIPSENRWSVYHHYIAVGRAPSGDAFSYQFPRRTNRSTMAKPFGPQHS